MSGKSIFCLLIVLTALISSVALAGGPIMKAQNQGYAATAPSVPKTYPYSPCGHPGPYPVYREGGVYGLGVGAFNLSTAMVATPFRVGDVFLDRCSRPPEYVPGPVNPYRGYCTPEIWVPSWQPAPYPAPKACPPTINGMIVAPEIPPLPNYQRPSKTARSYARENGGQDFRMVAQPERRQSNTSAFW